ncbi:MAG TPA: addiction module antidote protein, HigA family, partial [Rhodospirillaceae bacterium]|nr:addiction module antidote protein, HigA family [Rhodospirillaceae bacterium]
AFNTSAGNWLNQQSQYELWHAEQHRKELKVKKLVAA